MIKTYLSIRKRIKRNNTIVIIAPYFTKERLRDGYFKRVKAVDELFNGFYKVYLTFETDKPHLVFEEHGDDTTVVRYAPMSRIQKLLMALLMMAGKRIYCHSVWQVRKSFFRLPGVKVYVDVHGVVPEEETLYGRYEDAQLFGDIEEETVQHAECLICVTDKIRQHLQEKYQEKFKADAIVLPIFDSSLSAYDLEVSETKDMINGKPTVIYAGGIMKWQKIELMQESISKCINNANYMVYCPNPDEFWETWVYPVYDNLTVGSKDYHELCRDVYLKAHYGYVLRDDIVVNNVACPTKIADYFKYRIVPIVSCPKIGDFIDLGMQYITLEQFNSGELPEEDEWKRLADHNEAVLEKYIAVHEAGKAAFKKMFR